MEMSRTHQRFWHCEACQGAEAPCMAVLVGGSPRAAHPTECLQDPDMHPDWREVTGEAISAVIAALGGTRHGN